MQTLLVIDDSPEIHLLLDVRLRPENLRIEHAHDPIEGLARAVAAPPDLILLDMEMPGMTGLEVCARLKADPATAMVPVIFLTGAEGVDIKVRGFDLGAVDFVTKPFDPAELRARVRAALRTKRFHDMLSARAQIDGLTGLWNRGYFNQRLAEEVKAVRRYRRELSLVIPPRPSSRAPTLPSIGPKKPAAIAWCVCPPTLRRSVRRGDDTGRREGAQVAAPTVDV